MMRLQSKSLTFVVNFLLGASWATVFVGAFTSYFFSLEDGYLVAMVSLFIGAIPGMVSVLLLELFIVQKEKHYELQQQTKLLRELLVSTKEN